MMLHAPAPFVSFRWVVSHVPDWPVVYCESHNYFYYPQDEWLEDRFYFEIILTDFSVQKRRASYYSGKLPRYPGLR
ncbi:hypothetical protein HRbin17_02007 [bacterium HR17]|uniref:Uncharacterized protein n=1 Tax=Candidatus Fervidibacter japonicus TaxID=2035412 RepID=A0A2H5XE76_9BACT|nr:hypothetical protein HRbin17_02007 [bacterium HR17]